MNIYLKNCDLNLANVKFDEEGNILEAFVVNGAWWLRTNGTHRFAYRNRGDFLNPVNVCEMDGPLDFTIIEPDVTTIAKYFVDDDIPF